MKANYTVSELANLSGISRRTLHYYDEIGLLGPSYTSDSGYRYYSEDELETLQQILFYKELEFPLKEIQKILAHPDFDKTRALQQQKELLELKKKRTEQLIQLIDKQLKGEKTMSFQEFDMKDIEQAKQRYTKEAAQRWGNSEPYRESKKRTDNYSEEDWKRINAEVTEIFSAFAEIAGQDPTSPQAAELVRRWQDHISRNFYPCSDEILAGLGMMYVSDERFTESIDKAGGAGTAKFMSEAIAAYCEK